MNNSAEQSHSPHRLSQEGSLVGKVTSRGGGPSEHFPLCGSTVVFNLPSIGQTGWSLCLLNVQKSTYLGAGAELPLPLVQWCPLGHLLILIYFLWESHPAIIH